MKKRVNVFISLVAMTAMLLTGCSGAGGGQNDSAETPGDQTGSKVKLTAIITKHPHEAAGRNGVAAKG